MPIHCDIPIRNLTKAEFDEIDKVVMKCAYASQNALGRLCDERVYENDLALRLHVAGLAEVHTQVPVTITHRDFQKVCRFDLVANHALYELKTASGFVGEHDAQIMHYAMMAAVNHGKLINFRPESVKGRLRFNALSTADRHQTTFDTRRWQRLGPGCERLHDHVVGLIKDWGGYLDTRLYEEALVHFFGGETHCVSRVPVIRDGHELGTHRVQFHEDGAIFIITAITREKARHEAHLRRLIGYTRLKAIQWINCNHSTLELITLK